MEGEKDSDCKFPRLHPGFADYLHGVTLISRSEKTHYISIYPSDEPSPLDRLSGRRYEPSFRVPVRSNLHVFDAWLGPRNDRGKLRYIASYSVEYRTKSLDVWVYAETTAVSLRA